MKVEFKGIRVEKDKKEGLEEFEDVKNERNKEAELEEFERNNVYVILLGDFLGEEGL